MSSGPFKETFKALITTFSEPSVPRSLPQELQEVLHTFLSKCSTLEDAETDRIHEDLLLVYKQYVSKNADKFSPWLSVLRILRPALHGEKNLEDWWPLLVRPILAEIGHKRDTIEDARAFVLAVTLYDTQEDATGESARESRAYINLLLQAFLTRTQLPSAGNERNLQEDEFVAQELENVLVAFGRKMPQNLLKAIDGLLAKSESRLQALSLLSSFVRLQPPHLHTVLETELPRHLINCLLIDTSATVVDLALSVLIMFLPHITSALVSLLPKLFLVYSRVLCWDDFGYEKGEDMTSPDDNEKTDAPSTPGVFEIDPAWAPFSIKTDSADSALPKANYLFTFLYGLFPLNFMTFIRKPRRYLKMKSYPNAETLGLNQGMIRARTESHRSNHLLHPSFFTTTPEDELVDTKWLKSDPADLVSECLSLSLEMSSTLSDPGPPPSVSLPPLPPKSSHARIESETIPSSVSGLSPTLDAASFKGELINVPPRRSSRASLLGRSLQGSRRTSPTTLETLEGKATASLSDVQDANASLSMLERATRGDSLALDEKSSHMSALADAVARSPTQTHNSFHVPSPSINAMQREIMLLRNDLNLERYLKQQHITHIGQMQRKHIGEATVEADTQNLINTNRNLQQKLNKANELYAQLKKETATSRSQAKRYEETLSSKLKLYRDEEKRLKTEIETLRVDYDKLKADCEDMRSLVVESEIREHHTRNALNTLQREFEATDLLRKQIDDLESRVQDYELRDLDYERNKIEDDRLRNELETARMELESRDVDQERTHKLYEQKISILEARLRTAISTASGQMPASVQQMIDSALAASNSKLAQLKRAHQRLLQKYTELELSAQELQGNHQILEHEHEQLRQQQRSQAGSRDGLRPTSVLSLTQYADDAAPLGLNDSPIRRTTNLRGPPRKLHAFADPARFERADSIPEDDFIEELSPQRPMFNYEKPASSGSASRMDPHSNVSTITKRPSQSLASRSAALNADRIERLTGDRGNVSSAGTMASQPANTRLVEATVHSTTSHDFAAPTSPQPIRTGSGGIRAAGALNNLVSKHSFGPEIGATTGGVRYSGRGGAQSTLKKNKDKEKDKDKDSSNGKDKLGAKSGGFRGLKGIM